MDWSVALGALVIGYALYVLITRLAKRKRGGCSGCPYAGGCGRPGGGCS